jgi:hypothetical protein
LCFRKFYDIVARRLIYATESDLPELKKMLLNNGEFKEQDLEILRSTVQMLNQVLPIFEPEFSVEKFPSIVKALE